jgi:hypothetical protein
MTRPWGGLVGGCPARTVVHGMAQTLLTSCVHDGRCSLRCRVDGVDRERARVCGVERPRRLAPSTRATPGDRRVAVTSAGTADVGCSASRAGRVRGAGARSLAGSGSTSRGPVVLEASVDVDGGVRRARGPATAAAIRSARGCVVARALREFLSCELGGVHAGRRERVAAALELWGGRRVWAGRVDAVGVAVDLRRAGCRARARQRLPDPLHQLGGVLGATLESGGLELARRQLVLPARPSSTRGTGHLCCVRRQHDLALLVRMGPPRPRRWDDDGGVLRDPRRGDVARAEARRRHVAAWA